MGQRFPEIKQVFNEIVNEAKFAEGTDIGPSTENIGIVAAGDAGDWILNELKIPAAEAEIGSWQSYNKNWFPHTASTALSIVKENIDWLEYTYDKLGTQITIQPMGYTKFKTDPTKNHFQAKHGAVLFINVTNHGLSDQIHDDIRLRIDNVNMLIDPERNGRLDPTTEVALGERRHLKGNNLGQNPPKSNFFFVNGLEKRSSKVFQIPIYLRDPQGYPNFYRTFKGALETNIEYHEFATSSTAKNIILSFNPK